MKILCVTNDRRGAQQALTALRSIAPDVTLAWAGSLFGALTWVDDNRDLAALIVQSEIEKQSCVSFVGQVRNLGVTAPIIVIVPEHEGTPVAALKAGADDYVATSPLLFADLPGVLGRALERTATRAARPPLRLLYVGDATLAKESLPRRGSSIEIVETRVLSSDLYGSGSTFPFDMLLVEHDHAGADVFAILKDLAKRQLHVPLVLVTEWDERLAIPALKLGAADYVVRTADGFRALFVRLDLALPRSEAGARTAAEHTKARQEVADARLAADDIARRHAEERAALERKLADLEAVRRQAEARHAAKEMAAAEHLVQRGAEFTATLAEVTRSRDALAQQLRSVMSALERERQDRAAETAAVARLTRREAELALALSEGAAKQQSLERELMDAEAACSEAEERAAAECASTAQQGAQRQAALEQQLALELTMRQIIEQKLTTAAAARHEAEQRHASELTSIATETAARQARHDEELTSVTSSRDALAGELRETTIALNRALQECAAETALVEQLKGRKKELEALLTQEIAARQAVEQAVSEVTRSCDGFEQQLRDTTAALDRARDDHAREIAAVERLTLRGAELDATIVNLTDTVRQLERRLADADAALEFATQHAAAERETAAQRAGAQQVAADERLAQEIVARQAAEQALAEKTEAADTLQLQLADADAALEYAEQYGAAERAAAAQHAAALQGAADERLAQEVAARQAVEHALAEMTSQREALARDLSDTAATLEQTQQNLASETASTVRLKGREVELSAMLAERAGLLTTTETRLADVEARLQSTEEHAARDHAAAAERQATLEQTIAQLTRTRHVLEATNRRRFEHAPYGILGCTRDGGLERVNRALLRMLGYRTSEELKTMDVAARVFEAAEELPAIVERCLKTGRTESIETRWRKKDGRRLIVRLLAVATAPESVEFLVEDITALRTVEERLRHAERMEAVGRLASEVAATCERLLRDVSQECQEWLTKAGADAHLRYHGELLLADVTRAAGFLEQLTKYGKQQASAAEPVSLNRVLRDLMPVLKRVAGADVEFVLSKKSPHVTVDVDAERVERILINVASYARQRMPSGGQLKIDLGSVVIDRRFVAKYPEVRPGAHALITVTEVKGTSAEAAAEPASDTAGLDFGPLLLLVRNSGGHLWMTTEPQGLVLKFHLPRPASNDLVVPAMPVGRSDRRRAMARWFSH